MTHSIHKYWTSCKPHLKCKSLIELDPVNKLAQSTETTQKFRQFPKPVHYFLCKVECHLLHNSHLYWYTINNSQRTINKEGKTIDRSRDRSDSGRYSSIQCALTTVWYQLKTKTQQTVSGSFALCWLHILSPYRGSF